MSVTAQRTGVMGRDFVLLLVGSFAAFSNYAPLLSVVPLWSSEGGSSHGGVGAATGVTMATTVAVQLCMDRLQVRFSPRGLFAIGTLLLGLPTFAYPLSPDLSWVLIVSAVRGAGFGMVTVTGSALAAELVRTEQQGRALGWYGVAVGLPQVLCLPLGVWCAERFGPTPVFMATAAMCVLAAPAAAAISTRCDGAPAPKASGRLRPHARPWALMLGAACALGGITSFLPLAVRDPTDAAAALFVLSSASIAARWAAGLWNDRAGAGHLLVPSCIACAVGMAGFALAAGTLPAVSIVAGAVYGMGFGALQNDTLVVMFRRGRSGTASMVWNTAYDGGTGLGAVAVGLISQGWEIGGAFAVTAAVIAATIPIARLDSRRERARVS